MSSNRGFIWTQRDSTSSNSSVFDGSSTVYNNPSTIQWANGSTFITNNSIITNSIDTNVISNQNNNPILFPNGANFPDIWYNNAYEYTSGHKNIHWNDMVAKQDLTIDGSLRIDTIDSNQSSVLTIMQDLTVNGNLSVLGDTTNIASINSTFGDRYMILNSGYTGSSLSAGLIAITSTVGTVFDLSGSFTTTTVGTVDATGLIVGSLIQVLGSTSNDGIYEVLTHASNVLTLRTTPAQPHSLSVWVAEAVLGGATVRQYTAAGIEFSTAGLPIAVIDTVRHAIAYNTSAPSFSQVSITGLIEEPTAFQILARSENSNQVVFLDREAITGPNVSPLFDVRTCNILDSANTVLGTCVVSFVVLEHLKTVNMEIASFSINLPIASNTLRIRAGNQVCRRPVGFDVVVNFGGQSERCTALHAWDAGDDSLSDLVLLRQNSTPFPVGDLSHALENFGLSLLPRVSSHTYAINFAV